jgi:hypothetical protein
VYVLTNVARALQDLTLIDTGRGNERCSEPELRYTIASGTQNTAIETG